MSISTVFLVNAPSLTLDQFLTAARRFNDFALQAYTRDDSEMVLMHAAIAVENLSKALLFAMNPTFLVELHTKQFDALLHLTGHGEKATKLKTPRTIGAKEALVRVQRLIEIKTPNERLNQLIEIRDGAVHTGSLGPTSVRDLLTIAVRYANEVYDALEHLQVWGDDRWGRHANLVETLVEQSLSEVQHEVNRKIAGARERLRDLMNEIPEAEQQAVAEARQAVLSHLASHSLGKNEEGQQIAGQPVHCPACNYRGAACLGIVQHVYEVPENLGPMGQVDEFITLVDVYLETRVLSCRVCGVALTGADELKAAGVPARLEVTDNIRSFLSYPEDRITTLSLSLDTFS